MITFSQSKIHICVERITEFIFLPKITPSLFFNFPSTSA
ncbi:hypothetical protein E2C01_032118 [Portunus trituberculatus]|uniref:Uncharacterized protein n=1 Tax=Portunus trituberculatus TaxID=210409 RepID=A0A5B7F043_PORTR|nr:hypothetical protein [Portunus trituberculatus]